ncbi:MAG: hypothetical protein HN576_06890 [Bacteriovoracaceae bacterium]|nr:hypothetical protein [Bacteriovoracaceae bacterium]
MKVISCIFILCFVSSIKIFGKTGERCGLKNGLNKLCSQHQDMNNVSDVNYINFSQSRELVDDNYIENIRHQLVILYFKQSLFQDSMPARGPPSFYL